MSGYPLNKNALRNFGFLMGGLFFIIAAILFYKEEVTAFTVFGGIAGAFFFPALFRPSILVGVYTRWMKFADVIGSFNTKVILGLMYIVIFTPLRFLLLALGKDPLQRKFDFSLDSYWNEHELMENDPKRYEKQF